MHQIFDDKSVHYRFLHNMLPRERFSRINYIKKPKPESKDSEIVQRIARGLELSKREINLYKDQLKLDLTKYEQSK